MKLPRKNKNGAWETEGFEVFLYVKTWKFAKINIGDTILLRVGPMAIFWKRECRH